MIAFLKGIHDRFRGRDGFLGSLGLQGSVGERLRSLMLTA
jgi:hypothetical protein